MKDIPLNVQTTINSASVNLLALIFFLLMVQFSHERGKNTCARTCGSKREGGLFSGQYGTT